MAKVNNMIALLEAGIRAEELRQRAIANNVANLETPGYRRMDVKFEQLMAKAMDSSGLIEDMEDIEPQFYQPKTTPLSSNGNDVTLENEVGQMIENSLRHKALVRLLNGRYKKMQLAINTR